MARRRALLSGLFSRRPTAAPVDANDDPFERPADIEPTERDALSQALDEIEAGALDVYAAAGLPTRAGHYRREPNGSEWTFLAADLAPEERFALTLSCPPEQGWRFGRLQDLGAKSDRDDLRAAARLLGDIAELRATRRGPLTQDHLLIAMELGAAWRALRDSQAVRTSRLSLSIPTEPTPPRARRDKSIKSG